MLCTVIDLFTKWATVLDGKQLGTSRHKDYSLFHFKARDVANLKQPITKFVYVSAKGDIDEVILTDQLKARGVNYKTAVRDKAELTDLELVEVSGAYELARAHLTANPTPKVQDPAASPVADPVSQSSAGHVAAVDDNANCVALETQAQASVVEAPAPEAAGTTAAVTDTADSACNEARVHADAAQASTPEEQAFDAALQQATAAQEADEPQADATSLDPSEASTAAAKPFRHKKRR